MEQKYTFMVAFSMNTAFSPSPAEVQVVPSEKEILVIRGRGNVAIHLTPDFEVSLVQDLELTITGERFAVYRSFCSFPLFSSFLFLLFFVFNLSSLS
jgi:hypothetical protein